VTQIWCFLLLSEEDWEGKKRDPGNEVVLRYGACSPRSNDKNKKSSSKIRELVALFKV